MFATKSKLHSVVNGLLCGGVTTVGLLASALLVVSGQCKGLAFLEAERLVGLRELHLEDSACTSLPIDVSASVSYLISVIFNFSDWVSCRAALFACLC
jgi:hypothetical protein